MNPIFFLHPPKSAGSSVISFFNLNAGSNDFINFEFSRSGWNHECARLIETGMGGGHQPYGIHRDLKIPLKYCTLLRDPLARQISHYYYARNGKNGEVARGASVSAIEGLAARGDISLDEWVSESYGGRNIFCSLLSGIDGSKDSCYEMAFANMQHHIKIFGLSDDMSIFLLQLCGKTGLKFPFFIETNKTKVSKEDGYSLSDEAHAKFINDNKSDYRLFNYVREEIGRTVSSEGLLLSEALETVRTIQKDINSLKNPYLYTSTIFGYDTAYLSQILELINTHDLSSIEKYIAWAQKHQKRETDMFAGFVDSINDEKISGWAINLTDPEKKVLIEVISGNEVVASSWTGKERVDVANAGYPTSKGGFEISLSTLIPAEFNIVINSSHEILRNGGVWTHGWFAS
jgi:hypothetical protein